MEEFLKLGKNGRYYKLIRSLSKRGRREKLSLFVVEGARSVMEALNSNFEIESIIFDESLLKKEIISNLEIASKDRKIKRYLCDSTTFETLSFTNSPQGVMAVVKNIRREKLPKKAGRYVYLDRPSDPGNLGTIIRSLDFFYFDGLILSPNSVSPFNPKVVRATMGSIFRLPIYENVEINTIFEFAKDKNLGTYALMADRGEMLTQIKNREKLIMFFGPETGGIDESIVDKCDMRIRMNGNKKVESLNLGVAVSVMAAYCGIF